MPQEWDINSNEARLARALERAGLVFSHSVGVGPYEVDFRLGNKIIVEVDGYSHLTEANRKRDRDKDAYLQDLGFTVLRIVGDDLHSQQRLETFIHQIRSALKAERAANETDRSASPFADPKLERLRNQLAGREAEAARPKPPEPEDDSHLFLDWVGDTVHPPRRRGK